MKKSILLLLLSLYSILSFAQSEALPTPEERTIRMSAEMKAEMKLSDTQFKKIKALNLKYARIIQSKVVEADLSTWSKYFKVQKINKEKEKKLKVILSSEQYGV